MNVQWTRNQGCCPWLWSLVVIKDKTGVLLALALKVKSLALNIQSLVLALALRFESLLTLIMRPNRVLGHGLGLESQVLGPGLEPPVLGLGLEA